MMEAEAVFWREHFTGIARSGPPWLDASNERVQLQFFAVCLAAAGGVLGLDCADVGCGHGQLARMLDALGARHVTAVDLVAELIAENRARHPHIDWRHGDARDAAFVDEFPDVDRMLVVEMLQCVEAEAVLPALFRHVKPHGRLVCVVPNAHCPIFERANTRLGGRYHALAPESVPALAARLEGLEQWALQGLTFAPDQRVAPYHTSGWATKLRFDVPPNRLALVFVKGD